MRLNSNGFTLAELLVASALSSLVILLGASLFVDSQKEEQTIRQSASISWNTMFVSGILGKTFKDAGGASTRPWNALRVEDNCGAWVALNLPDCAGSDRITVAIERTMASGEVYPKINVGSYDTGTGVLQVIAVDVNGNGTIDSTECALDISMVGFTTILINSADSIVRNLRILSVNAGLCTLTAEPELQGEVLNQGNIGAETFLNGSLTPVRLKTIFWDPTAKKLNKLAKIDNVSVLDPAELHTYSDNIYDLQFGLGYDVGFRNQTIFDDRSSTDELLFNSAGDSMGTLGGVGGIKTDLKMLFVAIIAGTSQYKKSALGNSVVVLNGTTKTFPGLYLFEVERRFYLRNVLDFL
jgi:prepilin-type N-terminal cleavage/methylation domain-containing protein